MAASLYNADILRLATDIPYLGRLPDPDITVEKRSPVCGSVVTLDMVLDHDNRVAEVGLEVKACALGQASTALLGKGIIGKTAEKLASARDELSAFLTGEGDDPVSWEGLDIFAPAIPHKARHASILLAFQAAAEAASKITSKTSEQA